MPPLPQFVPNDPHSLAKNLRYTDPRTGLLITTQFIADYIDTIGGSLSTQIDNYNQVIDALKSINTAIDSIEAQVQLILTSGATRIPNVYSSCLSSGNTLPIDQVTALLVSNACAYNSALGTTSALSSSIAAQPTNLNTGKQYGNPSAQMQAIAGWKTLPVTTADTLNNIWLTIGDLRAGMDYLFQAVTPSCSQVIITFASTIPSYTTGIDIYFAGYSFVPIGFIDTGSSIVVTDSAGNVATTSFDITTAVTSTTPVNIPLSGSSLLPTSDYTITVTTKLYNSTFNVTCDKVTIQKLPNSITGCPVLNLSSTKFAISFVMSPLITTSVTYYIDLLSSGSVVQTQTFTDPDGVQVGTFSALTSGTTYSVRATTSVSGQKDITCTSYPITTKTS